MPSEKLRNEDFSPEIIPPPPFLGRRALIPPPAHRLFSFLDDSLFLLRFFRIRKDSAKYAANLAVLLDFKADIIRENIIKPRGVFGFFPAVPFGNGIIAGIPGKTEKFVFPRSSAAENLCLSDFLAENGDNAAFFAVSCGTGILEIAAMEKRRGNYLRSFMLSSIALALAEAAAEWLHGEIRALWKISGQGKRFSFGYGVCPDLSNQSGLFRLLSPETEGIRLTENFMMEPEASVSALVFHNPKAKYFSMK